MSREAGSRCYVDAVGTAFRLREPLGGEFEEGSFARSGHGLRTIDWLCQLGGLYFQVQFGIQRCILRGMVTGIVFLISLFLSITLDLIKK